MSLSLFQNINSDKEKLDMKSSQRYAMNTLIYPSINIRRVENTCHLVQKKPMRGYVKSRRNESSKPLKLFLRIKDSVRQKCRISLPPLMSVTDWPITISRIKK